MNVFLVGIALLTLLVGLGCSVFLMFTDPLLPPGIDI